MDFESRYQRYLSIGFSEDEARRYARADVGGSPQAMPDIEEDRRVGLLGGIGRGVAETAASYAGGIGTITGQRGLKEFAERIQESEPELTGLGRAGRVVGRLGSELAGLSLGGGLALKGATKLPVVGTKIASALAGSSRAGRALATATASAPIDALQAAAYDEGAILPGMGGAFAENLALSGLAGALLPAARGSAREAAREAAEDFDIRAPLRAAEVPLRRLARPSAGEVERFGVRAPTTQEALEAAAARAPAESLIEEPLMYTPRSRQKQAARMRTLRQSEEAVRQARRLGEEAQTLAERQLEEDAIRRASELRTQQEGIYIPQERRPISEYDLSIRQLGLEGKRAAEELRVRPREEGVTLFSGFPAASIDALRTQGASTAIGAGLGAAVGGATAEEGEELGGAVIGGLIGSVVPSLARKAMRAGGKVSVEDMRAAANEEAGRAYRRSAPKLGPKEGPVPTIQRQVGPEASADYLARFGERETLSIAEARKIANTRNVEDAVGRFYAGQKLDSSDIALLGDEIVEASNRWKSLTSNADELEKLGQVRAAEELRDSAAELYERFVRFAYASSNELSESARKMQFQREIFRQFGITTPAQYRTLVKNAIGVRELKPSLRAELEEIIAIADKGLRETKLTAFARKNAQASPIDIASDLRKGGLLAGPASIIRNFVGSTEGVGGDLVENPIASVLDRLISSATGRERVFADLSPMDRLATTAKGWGQGAKQVWKNKRAYLEAYNPEEPLSMLGRRLINYENAVGADAPAYLRGAARVLQKANNFVYGAIAAGDHPFYQAAFNTSIKERGLLRALNSAEVRSGAIKVDSPAFKDLVKRFIDPNTANTDDYVMAAFDAMDTTYKNTTQLASYIQSAKRRGGFGGRALEFLIPFANTPANIVRQALERTPVLGLAAGSLNRSRLTRHVQQMRKAGYNVTEEGFENQIKRLQTQLYAKQITGSVGAFIGYWLHKNGVLTTEYVSPIGASEGEREEIARRGVTGEGPLSLRIGDTSYSLASLGTIAPVLALGAALSAAEESDEDVSIYDKLTTPVSSVARTILEMPLLTGARDVIETLEGRGMASPAQAGRQLGSFVPLSGALRAASRALDVESGARRPETFVEGFLSGIPGLSERAAPRVTALGERVGRVPYAELQSIFQPFTARSIATGPIYDVLEDIGYYPSAPRKLEGETEAEYSARREVEGLRERQYLEQVLASVMQRPEFSEERLATDPQSRERLADIVRQTLSRVRTQNTRIRRAQELSGANIP
jgi:hypothetical protein